MLKELSRAEMRTINGGRKQYSCLCSSGKTMTGYADDAFDATTSCHEFCQRGSGSEGDDEIVIMR